MSHFFQHAFTMLRGAAIAQLIPLALLPVITRLYDPAAYGLFTGVLAIATILATLSTLRLEIAIVLPPEEDVAQNILRVTLRFAIFFLALTLAVCALAHDPILYLLGMENLGPWIYAAPCIGFLMALTQIGNFAATRHHAYHDIASATIRIQLVNGLVAAGIGYVSGGPAGLVAARVGGQAAGVMRLAPHFKNIFAHADVKSVLRTYKKFPLFNLPYSLIGTFTRDFLILCLTAFQMPAAAGFYGLARAAMLVPVSLVSSSLGQVFYREAARSIDQPEFLNFTFRLMLATACLAAPAFALFVIWDNDIFGFVFGDVWSAAGDYASLFAPVALLFMMTSWPERVFEVKGRQDIPLMLQIVFDGATIIAVIMALRHGFTPLEAVAVFAVIQCGYHLTYIACVFGLLRISFMRYVLLIETVTLTASLPFALDQILSLFTENMIVLFVTETLLIGGLCLAGLIYALRHIGPILGNTSKDG